MIKIELLYAAGVVGVVGALGGLGFALASGVTVLQGLGAVCIGFSAGMFIGLMAFAPKSEDDDNGRGGYG